MFQKGDTGHRATVIRALRNNDDPVTLRISPDSTVTIGHAGGSCEHNRRAAPVDQRTADGYSAQRDARVRYQDPKCTRQRCRFREHPKYGKLDVSV